MDHIQYEQTNKPAITLFKILNLRDISSSESQTYRKCQNCAIRSIKMIYNKVFSDLNSTQRKHTSCGVSNAKLNCAY